jgi:hypothetical protein
MKLIWGSTESAEPFMMDHAKLHRFPVADTGGGDAMRDALVHRYGADGRRCNDGCGRRPQVRVQ